MSAKSFRKEDVVGKTVIETSGSVKGKVEDVIFNLNGAILFIVKGADGKDVQIPLARVTGISDHVVVKRDLVTASPAFGSGTPCKFCGAAVAPDNMWCPSCGKSQS